MRELIIEHGDLSTLLYFWPQLDTREYYTRRFGQCHTFPALAQPRFRFVEALLQKPLPAAVDVFIQTSKEYGCWVPNQENGQNYGRELLALYKDIKENGIREPILLAEGPPGGTGRLVLKDGNHRIIMAHFLGLDVRARVIPAAEMLVAEWATRAKNKKKNLGAYQSIFINRKEVVVGHRRNALARMDAVRREDLAGKRVLVLGCNNGHDCFMAGELGASAVLGIDFDRELLSYAMRIATLYGVNTDFIYHDLQEAYTGQKFDTVLCFSIYNNIADHGKLMRSMKQGKVVYFEGHALYEPILPEAEYRARYDSVLRGFSGIELVWETDEKERRMYRIENA